MIFDTGSVYYVVCNHLIAYDYFMESVTDGFPWLAYECDGGWDKFKNGECFDTTKVARAGFYGDELKPDEGRENVVYYIRTNDETPLGGKSISLKEMGGGGGVDGGPNDKTWSHDT